mgnify:CR=1 FL=1
MLGSDPIAARLGAGTDPRSSQAVWKAYLRNLVNAGAAVAMLGPDVVVPDDADDATLSALAKLVDLYPPGSQMPPETTGALDGAGIVDATGDRVNRRVPTYYRHITRAVGKELAPDLLTRGVITPSAGLHVGASNTLAVVVNDAAALARWRDWSAEASGDPYERHSAPTLLLPTMPGGGVYLFRTAPNLRAPSGVELKVGGAVIHTGDLIVPIPPTRLGGRPVSRLGPARILPQWLRDLVAGHWEQVPA